VKKRAAGRQKSQGCRTRTCKVERVPTECVSGNWATDQNDARKEDPDDIYRVRIANRSFKGARWVELTSTAITMAISRSSQ
jgi:hypothetical protein